MSDEDRSVWSSVLSSVWHRFEEFEKLRSALGLGRAVAAKIRISWYERMGRPGSEYSLPWRAGTQRVTLRVGTSDFQVYRQLLMRDELSGMCRASWLRILDAGANIGLAAIELAYRNPNAIIVCVEPDSANIELLRKNVAPLGNRVVVVHGAVWSESDKLSIENPADSAWAFKVVSSANGTIQAYTIDQLAKMVAENFSFDLVKLDIEGAERELFKKNLEWTKKAQLIGVELHDWMLPGCAEAVQLALPSSRWSVSTSGEYSLFLAKGA